MIKWGHKLQLRFNDIMLFLETGESRLNKIVLKYVEKSLLLRRS